MWDWNLIALGKQDSPNFGYGMGDSNKRRKWDAEFQKKEQECGIRTPLPDPVAFKIFSPFVTILI